MSRNFTDCLTMSVKYLEAVKRRLHATKQWSPDKIRAINSWGSGLDGGGCMNSARQSIHGAPNSMTEDARTALGKQFVGLRTRWWRMHEQR
ncbi:hypothetical protein GmHk_15G044440 [Glycine max]|nr:hypothetical protein GmHk_15G044440 [Glycine max]